MTGFRERFHPARSFFVLSLPFPMSFRLLIVPVLLALSACSGSLHVEPDRSSATPFSAPEVPTFGPREDRGLVEYAEIREASGLVAGRENEGVLWTHNDSGDEARLFALGTHGEHLGVVHLAGITAEDWEDVAVGPGPEHGRAYLYVGDLGDNLRVRDVKYVYRIPEPRLPRTGAPIDTTLADVETIMLRYPDGRLDAETLLVDPATGDLYVVTKRSTTVHVYRAPFPQSTSAPVMMERVTNLALDPVPGAGDSAQGAVGGDISPSGLETLIKTYTKMYLWTRPAPDAPLFARAPAAVPYAFEPQGEAVAWAADGSGYFTLSEERNGIPARLYFYPRRSTP